MIARLDWRLWSLLGAAAAILLLQLLWPTAASAIWPPLGFVLFACALFRKELKQYDWAALKTARFWEPAFFAVTQGIMAQAAGIVIVQYGLRIPPPPTVLSLSLGVVISSVLFSAILEELIYRKALYGWFSKFAGFWPAAACSSALFALAHHNYSAYLGYFLLGLVWCRTYRRTGDIGVLIAAHMIFNAVAMIVIAARG